MPKLNQLRGSKSFIFKFSLILCKFFNFFYMYLASNFLTRKKTFCLRKGFLLIFFTCLTNSVQLSGSTSDPYILCEIISSWAPDPKQ